MVNANATFFFTHGAIKPSNVARAKKPRDASIANRAASNPEKQNYMLEILWIFRNMSVNMMELTCRLPEVNKMICIILVSEKYSLVYFHSFF